MIHRKTLYRIVVIAAIIATYAVVASCSKSADVDDGGGNSSSGSGEVVPRLSYSPALGYVEEESPTNTYGTKFKSSVPTLQGVSLQDKVFSIKSVVPAPSSRVYIEKATGAIYVKEHHGLKVGEEYVVSARVTDEKTKDFIDFDNAFTLGVMTFTSNILYSLDFEGENPMANLDGYNSNISICPDPMNPNNKVLKSHLPDGEYRSEVVVGNGRTHHFYCDLADKSHGSEFWIGFKILRPIDENYVGTSKYSCVFQIGPVNNTGPELAGNISAGHYQLQMGLVKEKTGYYWRWREFKSIFNPNEVTKNVSLMSVGQWDKFVLHCVFSADDKKGLIEVWQNGSLVYTMQRLNGMPYDDTRIKFGIYTGVDHSVHTPMDCYYDDVTIGNHLASYQDVVPKD